MVCQCHHMRFDFHEYRGTALGCYPSPLLHHVVIQRSSVILLDSFARFRRTSAKLLRRPLLVEAWTGSPAPSALMRAAATSSRRSARRLSRSIPPAAAGHSASIRYRLKRRNSKPDAPALPPRPVTWRLHRRRRHTANDTESRAPPLLEVAGFSAHGNLPPNEASKAWSGSAISLLRAPLCSRPAPAFLKCRPQHALACLSACVIGTGLWSPSLCEPPLLSGGPQPGHMPPHVSAAIGYPFLDPYLASWGHLP